MSKLGKMLVPRARVLDLMKVQCRIFSHTFNPDRLRMGNKILRARLKGPALAQYYPKKMGTFQELQKALPKAYDIINEPEEERLEALTMIRARGKGAPKKIRTKEVGKKKK